MQLHHPLLQLSRLIGRKAEIADVVGTVLVVVVVAELGLDGVGAQQSVRDEGARKPSRQDVVPQLQTQVVPGRTDRQTDRRSGVRRAGPRRAPARIISVNPRQLAALWL